MLEVLLVYLACGLLLTAYVTWRAYMADPESPLIEEGELGFAIAGGAVMTVTWPLWLYCFLEARR